MAVRAGARHVGAVPAELTGPPLRVVRQHRAAGVLGRYRSRRRKAAVARRAGCRVDCEARRCLVHLRRRRALRGRHRGGV